MCYQYIFNIYSLIILSIKQYMCRLQETVLQKMECFLLAYKEKEEEIT